MQQKASQRQLKAAFRSHLAETRGQARRVQQALKMLGEQPSEKTCEAMEGLLTEGQELMESSDAGALRDAMMITAAQKVEHYEIATYGTVRTYAQILGEKGVARLLAQTLKEEKAADKKLTGHRRRIGQPTGRDRVARAGIDGGDAAKTGGRRSEIGH